MRSILFKKFLSICLSFALIFFQGLVYPSLSLFQVNPAYAAVTAITVTSPNGSEVWAGGSSHNITWNGTWTAMNDTVTADLSYSTDGTAYTPIVSALTIDTSGGTTASGTYSWTVPSSVNSTTVTVKAVINDTDTTTANDVSDANFTIDSTAPSFSSVTPATNAYIKTTTNTVGYTLSEGVSSGSITITRASGSADGASPHTCTLVGMAKNAGAHTIDLTDNSNTNNCSSAQTLVDGTVYSFAFAATDAAGNNASTVTNTGITFDTSAPTLTSAKITGANTITIVYSESVNSVSGNYTNLTLVAGGARSVTNLSGNGTNTITLTFSGAAAATSDTATMDIAGTVTDLATNAFAGSTTQAVTDGQAPKVTTVSSAHAPNTPNASGSFKAGELFEIEVTYSEAVTVNTGGGTPSLALNSGGTATYNHGSGAITQVFNYSVGAGQNSSDLDYSATNSLVLNGGTMQDAAGNNTNNTLPAPGTTDSLGFNRNYIIDTAAPTLSSVAIVSNNSTNTNKAKVGDTVTLSFTSSETIQTPTVNFTSGGNAVAGSVTVNNPSGNNWTATYVTQSGDTTGAVGFTIDFSDSVGNTGTQVTATTNSSSVTFDKTAPAFSSVTPNSSTTINNVTSSSAVGYTLSEALASGTVVFTRTGGTADGSTHTCTLAGTALNSGAHNLNVSDTTNGCSSSQSLVDGAIYTITFDGTDLAGNTATTVTKTSVTYDVTNPTAAVTYSPNRAVKSGESLIITATFTEAITNSPQIAISGSNTVAATNMSLTSGTVFTYTHTVGAGNGVATVALSVGTDAAGNVVTSAPTSGSTFTVDNTAPNAPVISYVATDNKINAAEKSAIVVVGTAEANSLVTLTLTDSASTVKTGTQQLTGGGTAYSITINGTTATALVDGNIAVSVTATDAAGNISSAGSSSVPLDTVAPSAPVITSPIMTDNRINNSEKNAIIVAGTTEANSLVTLTLTDSASTVKTGTQQLTGGGTAYSITIDGTTATALVDGNITVSVTSTDAAGNVSSAGTATITQDIVAPTLSSVAPANNAFINNVTTSSAISYTLSEAVASGTVTITQTSGAADGSSPHTCTLAGTAKNSGSHALNLSDITNGCTVAQSLFTGAVYTLVLSGTDPAGNPATVVTRTGVTFDNVAPNFTGLLANNSFTNNVSSSSTISYTLSESVASGSVIFTRTGGTMASNFTCTLVGTDLNSGAHTLNIADTTNGCTVSHLVDIVDGAIYTLQFDGTDLAGNAAPTTSVTGVTYDVTAPSGSILINSNATYTNTRNVTLNFSSVSIDVATLELANGPVGSFQNPITYPGTSYSYTLPNNGDGTYTVRARFTDTAGNVSSVTSDTIILDTVAPVISNVSINNVTAGSSNSPFVKNGDTINLTASIADTNQNTITTSMIHADLSAFGAGASVPPNSYTSGVATWGNLVVSGTGDANITSSVTTSDAAGNSATPASDSIRANNSTPVVVADSLTATKNTNLVFTKASLLTNDTDAGLDTLSFVGIGTTASHGSVSVGTTDLTYTPANNYVGSDSFTYTVTDGFLTSTPGTISLTVNPPVTSGQAVLQSNNTVSTSSPQLVVGGSVTPSTVNIPSNVNNASLDVTSLTTTSGSNTQATLAGNINVNATTALGTITMQMPAGTVITGASSSWTGVVNVPQVRSNSTVTLSGGNGTDTNTTGVIEVGFGDVPLTLSKAVRLLIPNQGGRLAAYSRAGVITPITNICSDDTQTAGDALAAGGDCKMNVGGDLVIWTKHFTQFVAYTQSTFSVPGSPSCNDTKPSATPILRSVSAGANSVTLNWTDAATNASYYVVTYGDGPGKQQYGNNNIGGYGTTSFTVSGLSGGITYYFRVRNGAGCATGEYSSELSATPGGGVISGPAAGFAAGVLGAKTQITEGSDQGMSNGEKTGGSVQGSETGQSVFENITPTPNNSGGLFGFIGSVFAGIFNFIGKLFAR